jgi:hypothetical protein
MLEGEGADGEKEFSTIGQVQPSGSTKPCIHRNPADSKNGPKISY